MCAHNVTWGYSWVKSMDPGGSNAVSHVSLRQKLVPVAQIKRLHIWDKCASFGKKKPQPLNYPLSLSISFLPWKSKFKTIIITFQRIFSWNCSKCEKKCCFCEERSDFILSHMSEILSEFAQIEVWWRWISSFSGKARKNRFRAIWALNMLQIAKMPQKFPWAIIASVAIWLPKCRKS